MHAMLPDAAGADHHNLDLRARGFMARGETGSDLRTTLRADARTLKVERVGALGQLGSAGGAAHRTKLPHQVQRELTQQPRGQKTY
jgi:hypothetical protein